MTIIQFIVTIIAVSKQTSDSPMVMLASKKDLRIALAIVAIVAVVMTLIVNPF